MKTSKKCCLALMLVGLASGQIVQAADDPAPKVSTPVQVVSKVAATAQNATAVSFDARSFTQMDSNPTTVDFSVWGTTIIVR